MMWGFHTSNEQILSAVVLSQHSTLREVAPPCSTLLLGPALAHSLITPSMFTAMWLLVAEPAWR